MDNAEVVKTEGTCGVRTVPVAVLDESDTDGMINSLAERSGR